MSETKELVECRRLHEVASDIAEDENLSSRFAEMVLPSVSSLVDNLNNDNANSSQLLLGKGNKAFSDCTFYITNVQGDHKVTSIQGLRTPPVSEIDSLSPLSSPAHDSEGKDEGRWYKRQQESTARVQDSTVSSELSSSNEFKGITLGDNAAGEVETFDAYVCYCQEDLGIVCQITEKLEREFNLKLCIDDRDILPGGCDVAVKAELIKNRCRRILVFLSPKFLEMSKSDVNNFCYKFGVSLEPGAESRKVIPVIVSPCEVPEIMRPLTPCDYTKEDIRPWFWPKLHKAIVSP